MPATKAARRPSIFQTEMSLRAAWDALAEMDPDAQLTPDQAEAFVATFVNREAAIETRDEFGDFVTEMNEIAAAKDRAADTLKQQAVKIREGVERMCASALRLMGMLGIDELRGVYRILKVRRSRGAVHVYDEAAIPEKFWRTREDDDLHDAEIMHRALSETLQIIEEGGDPAPYVATANKMMKQIRERRRAVDKNAILAEWKRAGSDVRQVPLKDLPVVPGASKLVETRLVVQ